MIRAAFRNDFRKDAPLSRSFISIAARDDPRARRSRAGSDRLPRRATIVHHVQEECSFDRKFASLVCWSARLLRSPRALYTSAPVNGHGDDSRPIADNRRERVERLLGASTGSPPPPSPSPPRRSTWWRRSAPTRYAEHPGETMNPSSDLSSRSFYTSLPLARLERRSFARRSACSSNRITNTP